MNYFNKLRIKKYPSFVLFAFYFNKVDYCYCINNAVIFILSIGGIEINYSHSKYFIFMNHVGIIRHFKFKCVIFEMKDSYWQ